ncbi:MAG: hypothetical protein HDR17_10890 [Lachnospiraceae bacterium]|nr:hypothetical protein [Lachnospiraceae bacterium]
MDNQQMIEDFVKMMDSGMAQGVGHVNVDVDAKADNSKIEELQSNSSDVNSEGIYVNVQTMGCTDCSRTPLACSVPTLHEGLDDYK